MRQLRSPDKVGIAGVTDTSIGGAIYPDTYHVLTCIKSVTRVYIAKIPFLVVFLRLDMDTDVDVVIYMYLKYSPD